MRTASVALLLFALALLALASSEEEPLVRIAHYGVHNRFFPFPFCLLLLEKTESDSLHYLHLPKEPVLDFSVTAAKDRLSFTAYERVWQFEIWFSNVSEDNRYASYFFLQQQT